MLVLTASGYGITGAITLSFGRNLDMRETRFFYEGMVVWIVCKVPMYQVMPLRLRTIDTCMTINVSGIGVSWVKMVKAFISCCCMD